MTKAWLKSAVGVVIDLGTVVTGALVALQIYAVLTPRWIEFENVNVIWIGGDDPRLRFEFDVHKNVDCRSVQVRKSISRVIQIGDVLPTTISLDGTLPLKLLEAPVNQTTHIVDEARPRITVPPGQYQLTILASCLPVDAPEESNDTSPTFEDSTIIRIPMTVSDARVRNSTTRFYRTGYLHEDGDLNE